MYPLVQHLEIGTMMLVYLPINPVNTEIMQKNVLNINELKRRRAFHTS